MDKRIIDKWVMVVAGATLLATTLFVAVIAEWSWSNVATCMVFTVCGVVLTTKGLK